jgi:hypothetical protein
MGRYLVHWPAISGQDLDGDDMSAWFLCMTTVFTPFGASGTCMSRDETRRGRALKRNREMEIFNPAFCAED